MPIKPPYSLSSLNPAPYHNQPKIIAPYPKIPAICPPVPSHIQSTPLHNPLSNISYASFYRSHLHQSEYINRHCGTTDAGEQMLVTKNDSAKKSPSTFGVYIDKPGKSNRPPEVIHTHQVLPYKTIYFASAVNSVGKIPGSSHPGRLTSADLFTMFIGFRS